VTGATPRGDYRISLVRKGGFAGTSVTHEADSRNLCDAEAATLRFLIEASGLTSGAPDVRAPLAAAGRDLFSWEITVDGPVETYRTTVREDAMGPVLSRLVAFVRR